MKRLDVTLSTKDKQGKWRYTKVGSAFVRDDGSIGLVLDTGISVSTPDGTFLNLREPFKRDDAPRGGVERSGAGGDDLPF